MFNFVVPKIIKDQPYPALQQLAAEPYKPIWREFIQHSPGTVPVDLINYCRQHDYPHSIITENEFKKIIQNKQNNPNNYLYPIQFGWFSHAIDYIKLLPDHIKTAVQAEQIKILFYYHEGDNPYVIKQRLDALCDQNSMSRNCYQFVSGNTAADNIDKGIYFCDHELLYYLRNKNHKKFFKSGVLMRDHRFLALNRTHKPWRALVMSDLVCSGLLNASLWSYNTEITVADSADVDNIRYTYELEGSPDTLYEDAIDESRRIDLVKQRTDKFIQDGPYHCDSLDAAAHNDHTLDTAELFDNSYCSIVLETHFDAGGSGGAFLTEKTFKCLKHGHPFVLVGCPGSLATLRRLGYRTFDHALDNSYDLIEDNTDRWIALRRVIEQLAELSVDQMHEWYLSVEADLQHNSLLFSSSKWDRLNSLEERINYE